MTGGATGSFIIAMNQIVRRSEEVDRKGSDDDEMTESEALTDLIERIPFEEPARCFPVGQFKSSESYGFVLDAVVEAYKADMGHPIEMQSMEGEESKPLIELINAGILTTTGRFTSPLAQRYYYRMVHYLWNHPQR